jgi:hypothetical protein
MAGTVVALTSCLVLGIAVWGFLATARELRRVGRLTPGFLLMTYARELGRAPRALRMAANLTSRTPLSTGIGPGWVILMLFLVGFSLTMASSDLLCANCPPALLIPVGFFVWVGWVLLLVGDVRKLERKDET